MDSYCAGPDSEDLGIDPRVVRRMWTDFKTGQSHRSDLLWQMFQLIAWSRRFRTAASPMLAPTVDRLMHPRLLALLRCDSCGSPLRACAGGNADDALECTQCSRRVPIVTGIPRFVDVPADDIARRTQASFGYEWTHFNEWRPSGETNFNDYFANLDLPSLRESVVLDAGCGMGRHARQIARFAGQVVAVDFSRAIEQASRNVAGLGNVDCVQADLLSLPLADNAFDYVYSLGVAAPSRADTEPALAGLVRKVRPGGRLRVYLYWKRRGWKGALLAGVTAARRVTTRMPFGML